MGSYATTSGLNGAISGASQGASIGGGWGALIGGGLGLLGGLFSGNKAEKATNAYNDMVVKNTTQSLFDLRRQQNVADQQTSQALSAIQDNNQVQTASYNAQFGAADVIGSTGANTLKQVLDYQSNQAKATTWQNFNTGIENYNTQVNSTINNAEAKLKNSVSGGASSSSSALGSLVGAGLSALTGSSGSGNASSFLNTFNSSGSYTNQLFGQSYGDTGLSNQNLWSAYSKIGVY